MYTKSKSFCYPYHKSMFVKCTVHVYTCYGSKSLNYYKIWRLSMLCFSMVTVYLILTRFTNTCTDLICHTYPISDCFKLPQHSSSVCQMCTGILLFLFLFFLTFRVYSILDNPDLNSSICFKSIQVFFLSFYCFNFFLSL